MRRPARELRTDNDPVRAPLLDPYHGAIGEGAELNGWITRPTGHIASKPAPRPGSMADSPALRGSAGSGV